MLNHTKKVLIFFTSKGHPSRALTAENGGGDEGHATSSETERIRQKYAKARQGYAPGMS